MYKSKVVLNTILKKVFKTCWRQTGFTLRCLISGNLVYQWGEADTYLKNQQCYSVRAIITE